MGSFSSRCRLRSPLNAKGCQKWTQARYQTRNQFYGLPTTDRAKVPSGTQDYLSPNRSFAVSWVHTFSPTLFNELLVTGTRTRLDNSTGDPPVCYDCALGVPNPFNVNQWPGLYDAGFNSNYYFETQNASGFYAYYGLL